MPKSDTLDAGRPLPRLKQSPADSNRRRLLVNPNSIFVNPEGLLVSRTFVVFDHSLVGH